MAAVGKGPHFLQKNPPIEFSGYGPVTTSASPLALGESDFIASTSIVNSIETYAYLHI